MKKVIITSVLCFLFAFYLLAQGKKPASQTSAKRGKQVYETTCITCHQRDGGGVPHLNPPLIKTEYVLGDKSRLIQIVLKGLSQPIEIEEETYTNVMPAQTQLSDQQIADVLTYVRSNFGNKTSAITVAQVKAERAKNK